jgi:hypothetical protein
MCTDCPEATLSANESMDVTAQVGDMIAYTWSSANADVASSHVAITPTHDACGNADGPWVVSTLQGQTEPQPLLACQRGFIYELTFEVVQSDTGDTATSTVRITVE